MRPQAASERVAADEDQWRAGCGVRCPLSLIVAAKEAISVCQRRAFFALVPGEQRARGRMRRALGSIWRGGEELVAAETSAANFQLARSLSLSLSFPLGGL